MNPAIIVGNVRVNLYLSLMESIIVEIVVIYFVIRI